MTTASRKEQREADDAAAAYDPAANDYRDDLSLDPRCLWGWGPPARCVHMYGHACFRALGHPGKCGNPDEPPLYPCDRRQRPRDWDTVGRAEANA